MPTSRVRQAYKTNAIPTTAHKSDKIKIPRVGSVAKACTEVNTPERTKKVPNKESAKAINDNKTVQLFNASRLSVTANECINAVPASQGKMDAFSTGSQNHQPPQPNSV